MRTRQTTAETERWHRRRVDLLGPVAGRRVNVAWALGLGLRTVVRYELEGAPQWYELALEGLAARKQEGQARVTTHAG